MCGFYRTMSGREASRNCKVKKLGKKKTNKKKDKFYANI